MKSKQSLWLRSIAHFPAIVGQECSEVYVVRILKDRDHSTLSNTLQNFAPKTRQPKLLFGIRNIEGMKSKQWSGYEESDISKPFPDERALIYVVRILKDRSQHPV